MAESENPLRWFDSTPGGKRDGLVSAASPAATCLHFGQGTSIDGIGIALSTGAAQGYLTTELRCQCNK